MHISLASKPSYFLIACHIHPLYTKFLQNYFTSWNFDILLKIQTCSALDIWLYLLWLFCTWVCLGHSIRTQISILRYYLESQFLMRDVTLWGLKNDCEVQPKPKLKRGWVGFIPIWSNHASPHTLVSLSNGGVICQLRFCSTSWTLWSNLRGLACGWSQKYWYEIILLFSGFDSYLDWIS